MLTYSHHGHEFHGKIGLSVISVLFFFSLGWNDWIPFGAQLVIHFGFFYTGLKLYLQDTYSTTDIWLNAP